MPSRLDLGLLSAVHVALFAMCAAVLLLTAPGRIAFPDEEIAYQTTRSIWERGSFAIDGLERPILGADGELGYTFGTGPGIDGRRYGFFGHGISIAALPLYGLGELWVARTPGTWRHAIRSDHFWAHHRSELADGSRLIVSLTNCLVTALAAVVLSCLLLTLGASLRGSVATALVYVFGTSAWPYARTFLSEPLSTLVLLLAGLGIARFHVHRERSPRTAAAWLWSAGLWAGASAHVHVLNLVAIPCLIGYAGVPLLRERALRRTIGAWSGASVLAGLGLLALAYGQYVRFGDPFETGRFGLYSHFIVPSESLVAMLVSPGRSVFLYSPALVIAAFGWFELRRRQPLVTWFVLGLVVTRVLFVAARSDWWGGWAVGPRYLVPLLPFALLPLPLVFRRATTGARRWLIGTAVAACFALQAYLATHSIFEWMVRLRRTSMVDPEYLTKSHWDPTSSPIWGFSQLEPDVLSLGAVRLAQHGHSGLWWGFVGVAGLAVLAGVALGLLLRKAAVLPPDP